MAIKTSGKGDVTGTHVVWMSNREVTYVPSPVYLDGHLYTVVDEGILHCFEAGSGKAVWSHRLGGRFRSSLVAAEDNIYVTDDKGLTAVFKATPAGFKPVSAGDLNEFCYATPAISNGRIYIRTGGQLYCIGNS
jgi:outer membrane protein assembly factor BamB